MYIKLESDNITTHTVTFDAGEGTASFSSKEVRHGSAIETLPTAEKSGYYFDGWYTQASGGAKINESTVIGSDKTYYAHYKDIYLVTFDTHGGTLSSESNTIEVVDGETIATLPTATKSGYVFDGWYTAEIGGTKKTGDETINADETYHAHYKEIFTITFNTHGGTLSTESNTIEVVDGETIETLPTATKSGYVFDGWYTAETGGTKKTGSETISADETYHAQYIEAITVTFDAGEGTASFSTKDVASGNAIGELPTAERSGYVFEGWFTDNTYTTEVTTSTVITSSMTFPFVAKWRLADIVARVNGVEYETLAAAIEDVPTTSVKTTVTLLKDVTLTDAITINNNQNIELDLQSYTISNSSSTIFTNKGTLEIKNGTISSTASAVAINNNTGGIVNITGGTLNGTKTNVIKTSGTITMTGGTITCSAGSGAIDIESKGTFNMSDGKINATGSRQALYNNGGTVTISNNAYLSNTTKERAAVQNHAGTLIVTGGTIVADKHSAVYHEAGTVTIGIDDDVINTTTPVLQGGTYGLQIESGNNSTVYDGIFKGKTAAISDDTATTHNEGTEFVSLNEQIDETVYDVAYLTDAITRYTVTFNSNGGSSVESVSKISGSEIGTLPTTTKSNTNFLGWFTEQTGGEKVLTTTKVTDNVEYYAHFTNSKTVCRPATTIHSVNETDFGQIPSDQILSPGDAFDCDVNGDGTYDAATERFYYLTDNDNNAVFIYYNNTSQQDNNNGAPICGKPAVAYAPTFTAGPTTAMNELPTTDQWSNVNLYSMPRTITNNAGTEVVSNFVYSGKAARLATLDEIKAATSTSINGTTNELEDYEFLLENTAVYTSGCRSNYWLETPNSSSGAYRIDGGTSSGKKLGSATGNSGVRPVIEVPYNSIEGAIKIVEFDTIPTAMRNYFNNISTWDSGQSDSDHASFDTFMTNNLNTNKCVYFTGDARETEYLTEYCDQPNKYDTGTTGKVNVYTYNVSTKTRGPLATYVTANNGKLYNMIPNQVYYWESASDSSINGYVKPIGERRIISIDNSASNPLHKTRNVRDLGGIKVDTDGDGTIDGTIKYGKLFRGEKIWGATEIQYHTSLN